MRFMPPTAAALLIAAAVLSGCAQSGGQYGASKYPGPEAGIPGFSLASRTVASGEFVEVEVSHRSLNHRVEQVALVGPDGRRTISRDIRTERVRVVPARPGGHLGISGGSARRRSFHRYRHHLPDRRSLPQSDLSHEGARAGSRPGRIPGRAKGLACRRCDGAAQRCPAHDREAGTRSEVERSGLLAALHRHQTIDQIQRRAWRQLVGIDVAEGGFDR